MSMPMPQPNQYGTPYPPMTGQPYPQQQMGPYPIHTQPPMDGGYQQQGPYPPQGQFDYVQQPNYNYGQPTAPPPYAQEGQFYQQQQPMMQQPIMQQPMMNPQPQVTVIQQGAVGANPQVMMCPNCRETVTSKVESAATSSTHMSACLLGLIGWPCCCCLIPYCMDSCKGQRHSCPRCGTYLGEYNESSKTACLGAGGLALCCMCGDCDGDCCDL